jgi:hypothetical protein
VLALALAPTLALALALALGLKLKLALALEKLLCVLLRVPGICGMSETEAETPASGATREQMPLLRY